MTRLGIVTATLGRSPFLKRSISSVSRFGGEHLHVIVCPDPASLQNTLQPDTSVILQEAATCRGVFDAVQQGIEYAISAGCDLVTWINDDDELQPGFIRLRREFEMTGRDLAYGNVAFVNREGVMLGYATLARSGFWRELLASRGRIPFTQQGSIISARLWRTLGGFDRSFRLCADTEFFDRAILLGALVHYVPVKVALYRIHAGQLSQNQVLRLSEGKLIRSRFNRKGGAAWLFLFKLLAVPTVLGRFIRTGCFSVTTLMRKYA